MVRVSHSRYSETQAYTQMACGEFRSQSVAQWRPRTGHATTAARTGDRRRIPTRYERVGGLSTGKPQV